jgi:hypothetical protein
LTGPAVEGVGYGATGVAMTVAVERERVIWTVEYRVDLSVMVVVPLGVGTG